MVAVARRRSRTGTRGRVPVSWVALWVVVVGVGSAMATGNLRDGRGQGLAPKIVLVAPKRKVKIRRTGSLLTTGEGRSCPTGGPPCATTSPSSGRRTQPVLTIAARVGTLLGRKRLW